MYSPSENASELLEQAKRFCKKEIKPHVASFEAAGGISSELISSLGGQRYLGACLPEEFGGLGLDPVTYGLFTEEIGKTCPATRTLLTVHSSLVGQTLARWGSYEQKHELLPQLATGEKIAAFALSEPLAGSDAASIQSVYSRQGDSYVLNGHKKWISFGALADLLLVFAYEGQACTAFMVDTKLPGVTVSPMTGMLAGKATYLAEIQFEDVVLSKNTVLGSEGTGFIYIANTALDYGRYSVAWGGVGLAQEALEAMVAYVRSRKQFGRRIWEFQLVQAMVGDAVTRVHAARSLCLSAGALRKTKDPKALMETNIAKYFSSTVANEVAKDALQIHGGNGFSSQFPVERIFREAKVLEVIEGTSQIQQELIGKYGIQTYFKSNK